MSISVPSHARDLELMALALVLGARADHRTSPNPMVGAVVSSGDGRVLGQGYHEAAGGPHAEVIALAQAGAGARGASLYVTLEPCSSWGRTPPCVEAVLKAGVSRVLVAMEDPDRGVAGAGIRALREGGIEVSVGLLEAEARRLNRFYICQRATGRPFVTAKFAASLDGRVRSSGGQSRWITGAAARRHAHLERHRHDAVLVGINTVLADDPLLSARLPAARQPLRVVLDSKGRTPAGARVRGPGAELLIDSGSDLPGLLGLLAGRGILSLLVEGGPRVLGSFFDQGLVDAVQVYLAPIVLGGEGSLSAVLGRGAELDLVPHLQDVEMRALGRDVLISGNVHRNR
ncbi:MAG TPA: bifunctional diaminohydroxyphosphoribosylaminopyrimidine deaminase/5-amino-6-(5-phosphoribosylamino)uracil reductase RibD [Candidatus Nitrosotalea sp.]|nr:bifunctional diaminohydroxyphosphoribosylaminopyrimidine deaminase/5-amino-6-(5-phosphoribosylamino)uracil reductase RibD [Candidatus Nitrosotalea sp.]